MSDQELVSAADPLPDAQPVRDDFNDVDPTSVVLPPEGLLSVEEVAEQVRQGLWGVRKARRDNLKAAGYDYKAVLRELNKAD